jgi:hypothetical protein
MSIARRCGASGRATGLLCVVGRKPRHGLPDLWSCRDIDARIRERVEHLADPAHTRVVAGVEVDTSCVQREHHTVARSVSMPSTSTRSPGRVRTTSRRRAADRGAECRLPLLSPNWPAEPLPLPRSSSQRSTAPPPMTARVSAASCVSLSSVDMATSALPTPRADRRGPPRTPTVA